MNKLVAILPIGVLSVVAIVLGIFYFQEANKLEEAQSEIVTLEVGSFSSGRECFGSGS